MAVSRETSSEIRKGLSDIWLVGLGLIPLGLAFGLLMTQGGFAWWWTPIFSTVIYAGSMEFVALNMVLGGVGPLSAALTGFMVNFRHIFYGLTYPLQLVRSTAGRLYGAYALTDESYAVVSALPRSTRLTGVRLLTIQVVIQLFWVLPGIIGALVGDIIPPDIEGLDFALTALFIVLAYEAFQSTRDLGAVLVAAAIGVVAAIAFPAQMLIIALTSYFLLLLARFWSPRLDSKLTWRV